VWGVLVITSLKLLNTVISVYGCRLIFGRLKVIFLVHNLTNLNFPSQYQSHSKECYGVILNWISLSFFFFLLSAL